MTEAEWLTGTDFVAHLRYAAEHLSTRRQRLLAVAFCRAVAPLFNHQELNNSLDVIERYADGLASPAEVEKTRQRCRGIAQESYEVHRVAFDSGIVDQQHERQAEFAWAVSYAANSKILPLEVASKAAFAADGMRSVVWEVVGNPFRSVYFNPAWRTDAALSLARHMYETREFSAMPILADALQDAGCDHEEMLNHSRDTSLTHVRGCWVVDLVLGKD